MPKLPAVRAYQLLSFSMGMAHATAWTYYLAYQKEVVHLLPWLLPLMGTVAEITIAICEVPTGVVADVFSRKLSVVIGLVVLGVAFSLQGLVPTLVAAIIGSILWGLGETFMSGALEAWVTDEIPHSPTPDAIPGEVFSKGSQLRFTGIFCGALLGRQLAFSGLQFPVIAAGVLFFIVALVVGLTFPEKGFHRAKESERTNWTHMKETFATGVQLAKTRPAIRSVMLATLLIGLASESADRLWNEHLTDNLQFPKGAFHQYDWLALVAMIPTAIAAIVTYYLRKRGSLRDVAKVTRSLAIIHSSLFVAVTGFALAGNFWLGATCLIALRVLRRIDTPFFTAWINEAAEPEVRATVMSFRGQAHGVGEIGGGPLAAFVAGKFAVRAALAVGGLLVIPTALVLARAAKAKGYVSQKTEAQPPEIP